MLNPENFLSCKFTFLCVSSRCLRIGINLIYVRGVSEGRNSASRGYEDRKRKIGKCEKLEEKVNKLTYESTKGTDRIFIFTPHEIVSDIYFFFQMKIFSFSIFRLGLEFSSLISVLQEFLVQFLFFSWWRVSKHFIDSCLTAFNSSMLMDDR